MNDLKKHAGEFRSALRNNKYDKTETGIYFPRAKVTLSGQYFHSVNGGPEQVDSNLLTDEGMQHLLNVGLLGTTPNTTWYLALYTGNYTPLVTLTAATFPSTATESTSTSEGYSGSTRPTWVGVINASDYADNLASKASYTIVTATSVTMYGAALTSVATRGATTGVLMSATKFSTARVLYNADTFSLGYRVQATSS